MTAAALPISLIVPVFNGGDEFRHCLVAIAALSPAPAEVIVVEDGPSDGSGDRAREAGCRVVTLARRSGPAAARNRGVAESRGALLLFVDADVVLPPDAISRVQIAFTDPSIDALIGSYDAHPTAPNFVSQFKNLVHRFVHQTADPQGFTFWGACGAVRRSAFTAVGGFDEQYETASIEDIELGTRLTQAGFAIEVRKSLQVTHLKRWTLVSLVACDVGRRAIPWAELILARGEMPNGLNLTWRARVSVALTCLALLALPAAVWLPSALVLAGVLLAAVTTLDARLLRYLGAERGWWFATRAVPMQWLYYAYSGAAFGWVCAARAGLVRAERPAEVA